MKLRKTLQLFSLCFLGWLAALRAGQVVIDFNVPEYAEDGRLKHRVAGSRAVLADRGDAEIENLRLDIFPENGHNIAMTSPSCRFSRRRSVVESENAVRIETPGLLITGTGFRWNLNDGAGAIHSNVAVRIRRVEGLYRPQP